MILRTEIVEQRVAGDRVVTLVKDVVMTSGQLPLGMVRKRLSASEPSRRTVLLVHGFGQNRYTWHSSRRSFSAYLAAEGYDVFNLDLRGHGRSRRFGASSPRLLDDYLKEDVPAAAREALRLSGDSKIFLVGHSMGGLLAYGAGATSLRPVVRGVVTLGSPYRFGQGSAVLVMLRQLLLTLRFTGLLDGNPRLPLGIVGRHLRRRRHLWNVPRIPLPIRAWHPGSVEDDILDEYLGRAFDWTNIQIALDILRIGADRALMSRDGRNDYGSAFEHLDKPLLVIAGSEDTLAPPKSVKPAYDLSESTDKTYRVFPLGHIDLIIGREAPFTVWPLVRDWLGRR